MGYKDIPIRVSPVLPKKNLQRSNGPGSGENGMPRHVSIGSGLFSQQEPLHLHVIASFFETFLIFTRSPPFAGFYPLIL